MAREKGTVVEPIGRDVPVRPNPRSTYRELADGSGAVLLHLDTAAYHGLNGIGTVIWRLVRPGTTFGVMVEALREQVEDPPPELEQDVAAFLRALQARDLVLIGPDAAESTEGQAHEGLDDRVE